MERHFVQSTALKSIGYDEITNTLELEFRDNGGVWQYLNFSPVMFHKFIKADSLGRFFVKKIKGHFKEKKVSTDD